MITLNLDTFSNIPRIPQLPRRPRTALNTSNSDFRLQSSLPSLLLSAFKFEIGRKNTSRLKALHRTKLAESAAANWGLDEATKEDGAAGQWSAPKDTENITTAKNPWDVPEPTEQKGFGN